MSEQERYFDLNMEDVLDDWEIYHAIREIIANALDEQVLTKTKDIEITKEDSVHKIRDFGRGLRYVHFTQNEDQEKLKNPGLVIGKFGVGLKDALATLNRHKIDVNIKTKHGDITLEKTAKHGFDDITTLHAVFSEPTEEIEGTEFVLKGCTDADITKAKNLFLKFSGEELLDKTKFGEILKKHPSSVPDEFTQKTLDSNLIGTMQQKSNKDDFLVSNIFINGVKVAKEENFLFSYNITSMTTTMRKALNRERTNVGRTAYAPRIKDILLSSTNSEVARMLANDLGGFEQGTQHDELKWNDVSVHACRILNSENKVVFVTPNEQFMQKSVIDHAKKDGHEVVIIPDVISEKIDGITDIKGNPMRDLGQFEVEYEESFEYKFVEETELTDSERMVFGYKEKIMNLVGGKPQRVHDILITETLRVGSTVCGVAGLWKPDENVIIIKRSQLSDLKSFAGTLLHEIAHATSGFHDVDRDFEVVLTDFLGKTGFDALQKS